MKLLGPAAPRAIDHLVDEHGGQVGTLPDEFVEVCAPEHEERRVVFDAKTADIGPPARVRDGAVQPAGARHARPAPDATLVRVDSDPPGQDEEHLVDRRPDVQEDRVGGVYAHVAAPGEPLEFRARDVREE
jgi:hypothetical protein